MVWSIVHVYKRSFKDYLEVFMDIPDYPHRRHNPLTDEWVKVSPHRTKRPWQGQQERRDEEEIPSHDPKCYLCPGSSRSGGVKNPDYTSTFAFDNDFPALLPDTPAGEQDASGPQGLLKMRSERGRCRVICFSPRHNLTMARMNSQEILKVVQLWREEYLTLGSESYISHVQIFENRGEVMGCSNRHPHGQIWAEELIPDIPLKELTQQEHYYLQHGSGMLEDYLSYETEQGSRMVYANSSWAVVVPYWATWPFEVMVLPYRRAASLAELTDREQTELAEALRVLCIKYDNLFLTSFPYSMGIHQAATGDRQFQGTHMHLHYYPPLLRSAEIKKFMVGYEMMAMAQRDITPEQSARRLAELPEIHYTQEGFHAD